MGREAFGGGEGGMPVRRLLQQNRWERMSLDLWDGCGDEERLTAMKEATAVDLDLMLEVGAGVEIAEVEENEKRS